MSLPSTYQHANAVPTTIPNNVQHDDGKSNEQWFTPPRFFKTGLALVVAVIVVLLVTVAPSGRTAQEMNGAKEQFKTELPLEGIAPVDDIASAGGGGGGATAPRACNFDECYATQCDPAGAPYTCLFHNGGVHGGCASYAWSQDSCDEQCDLHNCHQLSIPPHAATCDTMECNHDFCNGQQQQRCGDDVPYQCMEGSGRYGCSDDPMHWTVRTPTSVCSLCCDVRTCPTEDDD